MGYLYTASQGTLDGDSKVYGDICECDICHLVFASKVAINPSKTITYCPDCTKIKRAEQRAMRGK